MAQFLNEAMTGDGGVSGTASDTIDWPGGPGVFMSQGTYNGATFQLQYQVDGSSWSDVPVGGSAPILGLGLLFRRSRKRGR